MLPGALSKNKEGERFILFVLHIDFKFRNGTLTKLTLE